MRHLSLFLTTALLVFIMSDWYMGGWAGRGLSLVVCCLCFVLLATSDIATKRLLEKQKQGSPNWPFPTIEERQKSK